MKTEIINRVLSVLCPTCAAKRGKKCELITGHARTAPHRARRLLAKDFFKTRRLATHN